MKNERLFWILSVGLFAIGLTLAISTAANAQAPSPIILAPDSLTGTFTASANTAHDDIRIERVCLYRVDQFSPDQTAEFACAQVTAGRPAVGNEVSPNGEGVVVDIEFVTVLVPGEDQLFVARNIAVDIGGEIMSQPSGNNARIPGIPGAPMFVIPAP
jgi:hypothetical protein